MLTPPHTPIEENSAVTNLNRGHFYEMELLRQRNNPILSHPSAYYHHMQAKHETSMAALNHHHVPQIPLNVQQYHQQQHQMWLRAHAPNTQIPSNYVYQVNIN